MKGLIGVTGFVGGNISKQTNFDKTYHSSNIFEIADEKFDMLICAGVSAIKWKANQNSEEDLQQINLLLNNLTKTSAKRFILISTIDVYGDSCQADEETPQEIENLEAYGRNRLYVEKFVQENFPEHLIVRLPGLFGEGIKKNFIYDMLYSNALDWTHHKSVFQFYDLSNLQKDIDIALNNDIKLLNITSEPISAEEIAKECFNVDFKNDNGKDPVFYDMRTKYAELFGGSGGYIYSKEQILSQIKEFAREIKRKGI